MDMGQRGNSQLSIVNPLGLPYRVQSISLDRPWLLVYDAPVMGSVKEETIRGAKWGFINRLTMQPLFFIYGIILARLVSPAEMGILGLTAIFFAYAGILKECGFGMALIRSLDRTEEDCSTVFWFNMGVSFLLAVLFFFAAPWLADFFRQPALVALTRVSALMMFLNSSMSVHWALYTARRDFKTPALVSMVTSIIAMPFALWAAFAGWSYWAVYMQTLISSSLSIIVVWVISPWRPRFIFSRTSFRKLFSFSSNLLAYSFITTTCNESRSFLIGKFYSPAQLALFSRAFRLCSLPLNSLQSILQQVAYPVLAQLQNDEERLNASYHKFMRMTFLVILWMMITLSINSYPIIYTLYGERWASCAPYALILCLGLMFNPFTSLAYDYLAIKGRSDYIMRSSLISNICELSILIAGACISVMGVCVASMINAALASYIYALHITKISKMGLWAQYRDFFPYALMSLLVNIPSALLVWWQPLPLPVCAVLGPILAFILYSVILAKRKDASYRELVSTGFATPLGKQCRNIFLRFFPFSGKGKN